MKSIGRGVGIMSLGLSAFFLVVFRLRPELLPFEESILIIVSQISSVIFALPMIYGLYHWLGKSIWKVCIFALYPLLIESFAIITGWPYSHFVYGDILGGPRIFGLVPWTVSLSWLPIFFLVWIFVSDRPWTYWQKTLAVGAGMTLFDLILDPGATALRFWIWDTQGWYFGVPLQNFFGWMITSMLGYLIWTLLLHKQNNPESQDKMWIQLSGMISLVFWIWVGLWLIVI